MFLWVWTNKCKMLLQEKIQNQSIYRCNDVINDNSASLGNDN